ncbi:MAG: O-antigen ligase family protein [Myxococcota bacterium]
MRGAALLAGVAVLLGASAVVIHPSAALGIAVGVAVLVFILSNPLNATLAFIVVLIIRPADHFPAVAVVHPAKVIGAIAILSWLISRLVRGDLRLSRAPQVKWMAALGLAVLFSVLMSTNPDGSWQFFSEVFLKMLIVFALLVHLVDTKTQAVRLHLSLAFCTVALALYAVEMRVLGLATVEGNRAGLVGLLGDPNDLALALLLPVPLFVELILGSHGIRRFGWSIPLTVLVVGIFATVSRGGALGLLAVLGAVFYDRGGLGMRMLLGPATVLVVVGLLLVAGVNERSSGSFESGHLDESAQGRLDMWQSGIRMAAHNPVFGVGVGQFPDNYQRYARNPVHWEPRDAHNSFTKAVAETGLLGFIPFMALVLLTLRTGYQYRKAEVPADTPAERAVRRSLLPSMVGFCVAGFFLSQCWSWFLFILFAQGAAIHEVWKPEVEDFWSRSRPADPAQSVTELGTVHAYLNE